MSLIQITKNPGQSVEDVGDKRRERRRNGPCLLTGEDEARLRLLPLCTFTWAVVNVKRRVIEHMYDHGLQHCLAAHPRCSIRSMYSACLVLLLMTIGLIGLTGVESIGKTAIRESGSNASSILSIKVGMR
jgi:hypothetical protein